MLVTIGTQRVNITREISVLSRYLRLGGPPGLIHWKIVAAWLKSKNYSQRKLVDI